MINNAKPGFTLTRDLQRCPVAAADTPGLAASNASTAGCAYRVGHRRRSSPLVLLLLLWCWAIGPVLADTAANAWDQPPLVLEALDGRTHSMNEWRGKVILLNFWASWCSPCQYEIPDLVRFQRRYAGMGLRVIGIGIDSAGPLRNVSRSLGINYPVLVASPESSGRLLARWGNPQQMVPYSVLIGRDGAILMQYRGVIDEEWFGDTVLPVLNDLPGRPENRQAAK